jgi:hypothetical protein|uniref:Uncharacterized protein n=1 Tax=Sipha flava TaxID=143950 RepID=A0A2S2QCX2_9HEMI
METHLKIFLTLPIGSANVERAMNVLRRLKNYLRSIMVQNQTSNLALLSMEYEAAQNLDMTELIEKFSKAKIRKRFVKFVKAIIFLNLILYIYYKFCFICKK